MLLDVLGLQSHAFLPEVSSGGAAGFVGTRRGLVSVTSRCSLLSNMSPAFSPFRCLARVPVDMTTAEIFLSEGGEFRHSIFSFASDSF